MEYLGWFLFGWITGFLCGAAAFVLLAMWLAKRKDRPWIANAIAKGQQQTGQTTTTVQ